MTSVSVQLGYQGDPRHGYTLADIGRLAQKSARIAGWQSSDYAARCDEAWSGIVAYLYAADLPPPERDLVDAGCLAVRREQQAVRHLRGVVAAEGGGYRRMGGYERYWRYHARATPSPEQIVVDRAAVWQILPLLSYKQRAALDAYIDHGLSIAAAADALGIGYPAMASRLEAARRRFLAAWHEHETPSRKWRYRWPLDRMTPCGTDTGYFRHLRWGEQACGGCREAHRLVVARSRARRKASAGSEAVADPAPVGRYPRTRSAAKAADRRAREAA